AEPERIIEVAWASDVRDAVFVVTLQIEGLDRTGLLSEVTRVVSEQKVPIIATSTHVAEDRVAMCRFTFEVSDTKQLGYLMNQLRNIEGVYDVYRVTTGG
ncbi:MAG: ACT domain-containing protein, partial [Mycobacteriaceae bacterium]